MVYSFNLNDKIVLITGGYGHLGKAITESLLYHGATVYVLARDNKKFLDSFKDAAINTDKLFFEKCDISYTDDIINAFKNIEGKNGK